MATSRRTFDETVAFLYDLLPAYQREGARAARYDLSNTRKLCAALGNPESELRCIHVAGTNGKGSVCAMIADALTTAGYRTGLYTSPHLISFTERIRIDFQPVAEDWVVDFVAKVEPLIAALKPSFFELTVAMAFAYFAEQQVDAAVIEVGMGGRLDSTNVITPELSVITNIGYDHQQFLGDTLPEIAGEKAGIIKSGVPVVVGEYQAEVAHVFAEKANQERAQLTFAKDLALDLSDFQAVTGYQQRNLRTALAALSKLRGFELSQAHIRQGVTKGLAFQQTQGRLLRLSERPQVILDVAHNPQGISQLLEAVNLSNGRLEVLFAVSGDKNVRDMAAAFPQHTRFHCTSFNLPRAKPAAALANELQALGFEAVTVVNTHAAFEQLRAGLGEGDTLLVCGSIFLLAELLPAVSPDLNDESAA